jgi:hypothetical protein
MKSCYHPRAYPGLDGTYCPDCRCTFTQLNLLTGFSRDYIKPGDRVSILQGHSDYIGKIGLVITVIGLGAIVEINDSRAGFPLAWLRPYVGSTSEQSSEHLTLPQDPESLALRDQVSMFGSRKACEPKATHWTAPYYVARGWFFRYYWMEYCDRKQRLVTKHKHIRGGNIHSEVARRNRKRVDEAIAAGWLPHQIVAMIASWPKGKGIHTAPKLGQDPP